MFSFAASAQIPEKPACANCAQRIAASAVPTELEAMPKGQIENVVPIGMLIVLGCENCAAEAVQHALALGSSREDIDRALNTVAVVQKRGCFNEKFGADVAARMEKPLAAARRANQP